MATEQLPERKARKSVTFTDQALVIDADGTVSMPPTEAINDDKDTAVSHSPRTPPLAAAAGAFAEARPDDEAAAATAGDDGLDLNKAGEDEFAEKLKAMELRDEEVVEVDEGDMEKGTGIWEHDASNPPVPFSLLLHRFYHVLELKNPDHATSGTRSYKIPPPQCMREGNKKTIFANIAEVAKRMKRTEEHITLYLLAELGTTGSVDGSRRLVIRGRFQQKQIENVLRKYIIEYVVCKTCKSPDTELSKGENRLYFITCNSCGSRRSVTAIKTGFSAQVGKRKKMQG
ncbi:eukaryotic translation initiation factor 2 beta subunit [Grosmannia clavigera kw1407]|uniref:Eukaryotic translation initiation factor 2 beta subunit n=1 Tax=Grosmannia clavigera (strain kw1407 / UAMH 11150) TaxID=655863 RepID=F0XT05_GROCL|nr:eukaryotic translation initiation factor 2 beta subunit [Grosmannia clavigera kw1407]EFW99208.1 eukaryotic translation initiation factor 2 beta subunit [Grosmannia clavigera kw1407]